MKRMLLLATTLGVLLTAASPAMAALQEGGSMSALAGPPPPDYVTEGGFLVHEGDISVPCRELSPNDDPEGARLCREVGFPFRGGEDAAQYDQHPDGANGVATPTPERAVLPDTGGVALFLPLASLTLVTGSLLLVRRRPCTRTARPAGPAGTVAGEGRTRRPSGP